MIYGTYFFSNVHNFADVHGMDSHPVVIDASHIFIYAVHIKRFDVYYPVLNGACHAFFYAFLSCCYVFRLFVFVLNEVCPKPRFILRLVDSALPPALDALQQPCHVLPQDAHGLQALLVLAHVVGCEAMH